MGSGRKGRDLDRSVNQRERPVATIVEYSRQKKTINAYPARIISPPVPGDCCSSLAIRVGEVQDEREGSGEVGGAKSARLMRRRGKHETR